MAVKPFTSSANTFDLKSHGIISSAMVGVCAITLLTPQPGSLEGHGRLMASLGVFLLTAIVAIAGCRAVRRTVTAVGDSARTKIQAHAFRAAANALLGAGFILTPFRDSAAAMITTASGILMVLLAALIVFTALTPRAVRDRLEGEADRRIAATG